VPGDVGGFSAALQLHAALEHDHVLDPAGRRDHVDLEREPFRKLARERNQELRSAGGTQDFRAAPLHHLYRPIDVFQPARKVAHAVLGEVGVEEDLAAGHEVVVLPDGG
jgi:hypothetical protein